MWLVEREQVGAVAYGRMQRDKAIRTLLPGLALPHDVPDSPGLRRTVLQRCVPAGCQVTGLGVLWAAGYTDVPPVLDVRTAIGRHVRNWSQTIPLTFHSVGMLPAASDVTEVPGLAPAIADALKWAPLELAVPATLRALGVARPSAANRPAVAPDHLEVSAALTEPSSATRGEISAKVAAHLGGHERALSAWSSIQGALIVDASPRIGANDAAAVEITAGAESAGGA